MGEQYQSCPLQIALTAQLKPMPNQDVLKALLPVDIHRKYQNGTWASGNYLGTQPIVGALPEQVGV